MLTWYRTALTKRPILTQCLSTSFLFAAGDVIAQQAVERQLDEDGRPIHNPYRTLRMAIYGGGVFGPLVVNWYKFLQTAVRIPSSPNLEIVSRVALDQVVFTPVNLTLFFSSMATMEGIMGDDGKGKGPGFGTRERVSKKLRDRWLQGLKANWTLWPGVQLVNFKFVPLEHRVLVVNLVSLGWNSYLSYLNQQGKGKEKKDGGGGGGGGGGEEGEVSPVMDKTGYTVPVLAQKVDAPARCDSV